MLFSIIISPVFATEINNPATCDNGTLSTDTGPTNLRANYESNTLNLTWYDDNSVMDVTSTNSDKCTYGGSINLPTPPTKRGYTFKGWKVIKYTPIEYIQSTGTQYIDTGLLLSSNIGITVETKVMFQDIYPERPICGVSNFTGFELFTHYNKLFLWNGHSITSPQKDVAKDTVYDISASVLSSGLNMTVNGVDYTSNGTPTSVSNKKFYLFAYNDLSGGYGMLKMYYFKLYNNGTLVRDMIPVKDSNGVACMYDKVSGNFFYNAGTGNFIAGPDL